MTGIRGIWRSTVAKLARKVQNVVTESTDELKSIRGQLRSIPLYSVVAGNGNNAQFTVVAFVGITIVDVRLTGPLGTRSITIQPAFVVDMSAIGGGEDGVTSRYIRTPPRLTKF